MLFSFLDIKTEHFGVPFEALTFEDAKRIFLTLLSGSNNSMLTQYPDDFILYHIGDFDKENGRLLPNEAPYRILTGLEALRMLNNLRKERLENVDGQQIECVTEDLVVSW